MKTTLILKQKFFIKVRVKVMINSEINMKTQDPKGKKISVLMKSQRKDGYLKSIFSFSN